ncbi:hypothetical protein [Nocardia arthritidis]|uniref:Secreted protein n=1 Tax=Nocardia arthritidis TaxID=228602 RepID=A0A6G9Y750_9NOCA|nr:hypothetical protein [Nocardia arthritidis]QIS09041.1 hypothetical protein F5544_05645 [Nocardia arthritidis]
MKHIRKSIVATLIVFASGAIAFATPQVAAAVPAADTVGAVQLAEYGGNCTAGDNLGDKADSFISRCRKGSIRREFPGQLLQATLGEIKKGTSADYKKAWKLLNDNRFKK